MARVTEEAISRHREKVLADYHAGGDDARKRAKESRARRFEERPFVSWDGEGYRYFAVDSNGEADVRHAYMLFGSSTGYYVWGRSLSTRECLDSILFVEAQHPDCFHVTFAFEYDVNMILRDLPWRMLGVLYDVGKCRWEGYRIQHVPHKMFRISKGGISATLYDTFGFFHSSYLAALKKYRIGTPDQIAIITDGKSGRNRFTYADIEKVIRYWSVEISLHPALMDEVRTAAYGGGYRVSEWHGPGALASYALRYYHVNKLKGRKRPAEVNNAIRCAYAGGRFHAWRCGYYPRSVYTADLNSAYIYACSLLPRMDNGQWRRVDPDSVGPANIARFGLYKIAFDAGGEWAIGARKRGMPEPPLPLFHRDRNGRLTWPRKTEGWYWSPEASLVVGSPHARVLEAWVFDDDGSYPFQWVNEAYNRRLILQQQGNPAEKAYKWALAAMYGAFARRVGWDKKTRRAPSSHELAWAGFITSWCRAAVYKAACQVAKKGGLISIDTDGVLSSVPFEADKLDGGEGTGLGQWKLDEYDECLYWQNGIYWYRTNGEWSEAKSRGIPKGVIDVDAAFDALDSANYTERPYRHAVIRVLRTRFVGYRQGLRSQFRKWQHWYNEPVEITMGGSGKGRHLPPFCRKCNLDSMGTAPEDLMHTITHIPPKHVDSQPHKLPWLEPEAPEPGWVLETEFIWRDDDVA
jgi:hypothetical protein